MKVFYVSMWRPCGTEFCNPFVRVPDGFTLDDVQRIVEEWYGATVDEEITEAEEDEYDDDSIDITINPDGTIEGDPGWDYGN